jgi:putative transcriptional regulator
MPKEKNELVAALEEGLEAVRSGARLRTKALTIEAPPRYTPKKILVIRKTKIGASQTAFARYLGVSPSTVRAWEQAQRVPSLLARRLLQIAERHPEAVLDAAGA